MSGIYSGRKLEKPCRRGVNFMYLLGREAAPDHIVISERIANGRAMGNSNGNIERNNKSF